MNRNDIKTIFSKQFREAIEMSGYSYKQVAAYLGVSKNSIFRYLHEQSIPTADILYLISEYLDVSTDYLLGKKDI